MLGVSYPTVRARFDAMVRALGYEVADRYGGPRRRPRRPRAGRDRRRRGDPPAAGAAGALIATLPRGWRGGRAPCPAATPCATGGRRSERPWARRSTPRRSAGAPGPAARSAPAARRRSAPTAPRACAQRARRRPRRGRSAPRRARTRRQVVSARTAIKSAGTRTSKATRSASEALTVGVGEGLERASERCSLV